IRGQAEAEARLLRSVFAKLDVFLELGIAVCHALIRMADPESQQVFWYALLAQMRDPDRIDWTLREILGDTDQNPSIKDRGLLREVFIQHVVKEFFLDRVVRFHAQRSVHNPKQRD